MKLFIYFSDILGHQVLDANNVRVGKVGDVCMALGHEIYPKANELIIRKGHFIKQFAKVPFSDIEELTPYVRLKIPANQLVFQPERFKADFSLCRDILDQQVVDTNNLKVVRVNDAHFLRLQNQLYLAHVDVGMRGLVRRLEWTPLVDILVKMVDSKSPFLTEEDFIPWKYTHVLRSGRLKNVLQLDVARAKLSKIPPTAMAEIMKDLDIFEKVTLFRSLEPGAQPKVFTDLAFEHKEELISQLEDGETVKLLETIPADEATDILIKLPKDRAQQLMQLMQTTTSKKLRTLLGFAQSSAGGLMTTEYLYLKEDALVKDALEKLKQNTQFAGNIYNMYVVDKEHRYVGTASLRRFISEDPNKPIKDICYPQQIFVYTDDDMEKVALLLEKYKFTSIPVVNEDQIILGVVTIDDVLEELISLAWSKYRERL
jgi:magnesium transporter